jgi:hemolysin D
MVNLKRWRPSALLRATQTALEQRVQTGQQDVLLVQSRRLARAITWSLIGGTGLALAWLALAKTDEVVIAPGKLEPIDQVKTVQIPVGGVLKEILVSEGQQVSQGQELLRLDNEATSSRDKELRSSLLAKAQQLALKKQELQRYLQLNSAEQQVTRETLALERQIASRFDRLAQQGASAELQALQQRNKVKEVAGQLQRLGLDRRRQQTILDQQIQQLQGELSELRSRLSETAVTLRYQNIRSPVAGLVFELKPKAPGFVAQGSEPVMQIVPLGRMRAKVEIASDKIGFVRPGQKVDLSIDSFPSSDFGVLHGSVLQVGSDALPPDQLKQTYRFPAVIALNSQTLKLRQGQGLPLQVGMSLTANIKLRKVTYLQLLLAGLQDKAQSLRQL